MPLYPPGPLPNLHAFRLFFSPRLIRFFSSPGFTASLLLFILSLSTPSPFLPLLPSWCFLSLPSLLLTSALHFLCLLPFPCLLFFFFFPSWCLFYPSSPLPCSLQILPPLTVDFFTLALSSFFSCCFSPLPPSAAFLPHHLNNAMTKIQKCIYNKQSISCLPSHGLSFPPPFFGPLIIFHSSISPYNPTAFLLFSFYSILRPHLS